MMNDEQFEIFMRRLDSQMLTDMASQLRARDTAQREALASLKLTVELWKEQYDSVVRCGSEAIAERDAAQAQLESSINLTPYEIQSGFDRVEWAEGLIRQLPERHEGRNSWLANYAESVSEKGEALARVEADVKREKAEAWELCGIVDERTEERDTAQAQLAEAVVMLHRYQELVSTIDMGSATAPMDWCSHFRNEVKRRKVELGDFLARHAQAKHQEAQGAQAGDEPVGTFKSFEALLKNIEATWFAGADLIRSRDVAQRKEIAELRAALATQPAEWIDPCPLTGVGKYYDQGFADGVAEAKRLNAVRGAEHDQ